VSGGRSAACCLPRGSSPGMAQSYHHELTGRGEKDRCSSLHGIRGLFIRAVCLRSDNSAVPLVAGVSRRVGHIPERAHVLGRFNWLGRPGYRHQGSTGAGAADGPYRETSSGMSDVTRSNRASVERKLPPCDGRHAPRWSMRLCTTSDGSAGALASRTQARTRWRRGGPTNLAERSAPGGEADTCTVRGRLCSNLLCGVPAQVTMRGDAPIGGPARPGFRHPCQ